LFLQKKSQIFIYDRFGKLLKQIFPFGSGWDGKYNNNDMPSDDYWFTVDYDWRIQHINATLGELKFETYYIEKREKEKNLTSL
jgi:gliding motility-associated-like protein